MCQPVDGVVATSSDVKMYRFYGIWDAQAYRTHPVLAGHFQEIGLLLFSVGAISVIKNFAKCLINGIKLGN